MAERIFLHVGTPKSGTSYLQSVLWTNVDRLHDQGLLLPGNFQLHYTAAKGVTARPGMAHRTRARDAVAWRRLVRMMRRWPAAALVSHELLAPATAEQAATARAALGDTEVHLILTMRALQKQIPAAWQEQVKGGHGIAYDRFLEQVRSGSGSRGAWFWRVQDVVDIVGRWAPDLPPERIHVVTCPPSSDDPSLLWRRYAAVLGVATEGYDLDVPVKNASLGAAEAELLRRVQAARDYRFLDPDRLLWTRRLLASRVLAVRDGDPITLPPPARAWVEQRTRAMRESIETAGWDVVGDLDDLDWTSVPSSARVVTDISEREIADVSSWTIARLQEELVQREPGPPYPDVGPDDGVAGIVELLEHIRAADTGTAPRPPDRSRAGSSGLRGLATRLRR